MWMGERGGIIMCECNLQCRFVFIDGHRGLSRLFFGNLPAIAHFFKKSTKLKLPIFRFVSLKVGKLRRFLRDSRN